MERVSDVASVARRRVGRGDCGIRRHRFGRIFGQALRPRGSPALGDRIDPLRRARTAFGLPEDIRVRIGHRAPVFRGARICGCARVRRKAQRTRPKKLSDGKIRTVTARAWAL